MKARQRSGKISVNWRNSRVCLKLMKYRQVPCHIHDFNGILIEFVLTGERRAFACRYFDLFRIDITLNSFAHLLR